MQKALPAYAIEQPQEGCPRIISSEQVDLILDGERSGQFGLCFRYDSGMQIETSNLKMENQEAEAMATTAKRLFEAQARVEALYNISKIFIDMRAKVGAIRFSDVEGSPLTSATGEYWKKLRETMKHELDVFFSLFDELRAHQITFVRLGEMKNTNAIEISAKARALYEGFAHIGSQSSARTIVI